MADLIDIAGELAEWQLEMAMLRHKAKTQPGEGTLECEECGESIPEARRKALPGCRTCVDCQELREVRR